MNLNWISIVSHSFGCLISSLYADKFPSRVKNLCLLSPYGFVTWDSFDPPYKSKCHEKCIFKCCQKCNITSHTFLKCAGRCCGKSIINCFMKKDFKHLSKDENKSLINYMYYIWMFKTSGEHWMIRMLDDILIAHWPIETFLNELSTNVNLVVLFGDRDWANF